MWRSTMLACFQLAMLQLLLTGQLLSWSQYCSTAQKLRLRRKLWQRPTFTAVSMQQLLPLGLSVAV